MNTLNYRIVILTGFVIFLILLLLAGCGGDLIETSVQRQSVQRRRIDYRMEVVEVEGMACVIYHQSNSGGITCNWEEWEGQVEGGNE